MSEKQIPIKYSSRDFNSIKEQLVNYAKAYYGNVQCYELLTTWGYMDKEEGTEKAFLNLMKAKEIDSHLPEHPMCYVNKCDTNSFLNCSKFSSHFLT